MLFNILFLCILILFVIDLLFPSFRSFPFLFTHPLSPPLKWLMVALCVFHKGWLDPSAGPHTQAKDAFADPAVTANYTLSWLEGAKNVHNLTIDYMGQ